MIILQIRFCENSSYLQLVAKYYLAVRVWFLMLVDKVFNLDSYSELHRLGFEVWVNSLTKSSTLSNAASRLT